MSTVFCDACHGVELRFFLLLVKDKLKFFRSLHFLAFSILLNYIDVVLLLMSF